MHDAVGLLGKTLFRKARTEPRDEVSMPMDDAATRASTVTCIALLLSGCKQMPQLS